MKIKYVEVPYPKSNDRNVTLLYVDGVFDYPSSRFLIYEAAHGGRRGDRSAESTHKNKAIQIGELYENLFHQGKTWKNALEIDVKMIRNAMLCWDANGNKALKDYDYKPISNDVMNAKIGMWFKFYNYMKKIGESFDMVMTTRQVAYHHRKEMLYHLNNTTEIRYVWDIKVKPSPTKFTYHALTRFDYHFFEEELTKIDIVYAMIAYLMVETGLRIGATLKVREDTFKNYFIHINKGKGIDTKKSSSQNNFIPMEYVNKGGFVHTCDLPIRAIINIKQKYVSREHTKRKKIHSDRYGIKGNQYEKDAMWLLSNGKVVKSYDVLKAFKKASHAIGYTVNTITPHWMRHTFSTWLLINNHKAKNIDLNNIGITPSTFLMGILAGKLGQISPETAMIYTRTAYKILPEATGKGPIMSFRDFKDDKRSQEIVISEARKEFGDSFDSKKFNLYKYAKARLKISTL